MPRAWWKWVKLGGSGLSLLVGLGLQPQLIMNARLRPFWEILLENIVKIVDFPLGQDRKAPQIG